MARTGTENPATVGTESGRVARPACTATRASGVSVMRRPHLRHDLGIGAPGRLPRSASWSCRQRFPRCRRLAPWRSGRRAARGRQGRPAAAWSRQRPARAPAQAPGATAPAECSRRLSSRQKLPSAHEDRSRRARTSAANSRHGQHGRIWNQRKAAHRQGSQLRSAVSAQVGNDGAHPGQLLGKRPPVLPIERCGMKKDHRQAGPGVAKGQRRPIRLVRTLHSTRIRQRSDLKAAGSAPRECRSNRPDRPRPPARRRRRSPRTVKMRTSATSQP